MLTTGSAARMCAVKPDTVLKWVRSGRLAATRTPGGHFRIDPKELEEFLGVANAKAAEPAPAEPRPLFCWEYMSPGGVVPERCSDCLAFQSETRKCWTLRGCLENQYNLHIIPCGSDCKNCTLYDRMKSGVFRTLVVTRDSRIRESLEKKDGEDVEFRMVADGYEASTVLGHYCAALTIVDVAVLRTEPNLVHHLLSDRRTCGMRVAVAGRLSKHERLPRGIIAHLGIPFDVTEIREIASWFPVERISRMEPPFQDEKNGAGETPSPNS